MANPLEMLGKNIARARERAGFKNQTDFANEVGVTQATVSAWEAGKIDIPYATLYRIAEKTKTSAAALSDPNIPIPKESIEALQLAAINGIFRLDRESLETVLDVLQAQLDSISKKSQRRATGP